MPDTGTQENVSPFNWESGKWNHPSDKSDSIEIMISGDWAPIRKFESIISTDPTAIYGDLLPELQKCDLCITNLECPLTMSETAPAKSGTVFKGLPHHVSALQVANFSIVTTANNHVFDFGEEGFSETHRVLAENNILSVGSGFSHEMASIPLVTKIGEIKLGIVNFSEGEDLKAAEGDKAGVFGWEIDRVKEIVKNLRSQVDCILVIVHCGVEYIPFPPPYVVEAFQQVADCGADLVIGHHPHVPQGIQIHGSTPLCYSLGNYIFYQETDLLYRKIGYMVKAAFSKNGLKGIEVIPYEIGNQALKMLTGERRKWFFELLEEISNPLNTRKGTLEAWYGFLAWYGKKGFVSEVNRLLYQMEKDPKKGAAMFRNRVTTMQHSQHWTDALTRIIDDTIDQAPDWSLELQDRYFATRIKT